MIHYSFNKKLSQKEILIVALSFTTFEPTSSIINDINLSAARRDDADMASLNTTIPHAAFPAGRLLYAKNRCFLSFYIFGVKQSRMYKLLSGARIQSWKLD
jgi:hypothetical protein